MKIPFTSLGQICALGAVILTGCASDRAVSKIAIHAAQNVAAYDAEVSNKVAAEKAFYQSQTASLRKILGGVSAPVADDPEATELARLRSSLPYGRIETVGHREARIMADRIAAGSTPATMEELINYIESGVAREQTDLLDFIQRQRTLAGEFQKSLIPIEQQKEQLKQLRNSLTQLAAKPKLGDQLKLAIEFGRAIQEEIKKQKN
jgi:hypothetical protein